MEATQQETLQASWRHRANDRRRRHPRQPNWFTHTDSPHSHSQRIRWIIPERMEANRLRRRRGLWLSRYHTRQKSQPTRRLSLQRSRKSPRQGIWQHQTDLTLLRLTLKTSHLVGFPMNYKHLFDWDVCVFVNEGGHPILLISQWCFCFDIDGSLTSNLHKETMPADFLI